MSIGGEKTPAQRPDAVREAERQRQREAERSGAKLQIIISVIMILAVAAWLLARHWPFS